MAWPVAGRASRLGRISDAAGMREKQAGRRGVHGFRGLEVLKKHRSFGPGRPGPGQHAGYASVPPH